MTQREGQLMKNVVDNVQQLIGETPIIRIKEYTEAYV